MNKIQFISFIALLALMNVCISHPATGLDVHGQMQVIVKAGGNDFAFAPLDNGVQIRVGNIVKNVAFYSADTVRINSNAGTIFTTQPSLVVIERPAKVSFTLQQSPQSLSMITKKLRINISRATGALTFLRANGELLYQEMGDHPQSVRKLEISGAPTYEVTHSFQPQPDESLYGLGQYNSPYMDYRGKEVLLVQTNIGIVVPFMISTRRYGLLWDIYSKMTFKDDAKGATLWAESAPAGVDYYFIAGDDMDGVIRGYRQLTGTAPMLPKQAFGLFMSKERYKTQQQLLDVASTFRREQFPLDYIVQDWQYWGGDKDGTWSGMVWNKERFPDPKVLTATLHDQLHLKLMASIWPSIGNDTELAHELDAKGLRFEPLHWISKQARVYDAFSPEGRKIYFKHIKSGLLDVGVDALWMDGTEVEVGGACHDPNEVEHDIKGLGNNALGDFTRYLNVYSLLTTEGTYDGQRAISDKRVFTLTRSAWAGQQRYAALPWSGDTTASWQTLRNQISGGINVAMAGLPYWTQDTGGFFVMNYPGGEHNKEYQELYARWNQFGIFNPVYRIHGTSIEREPYLFKTSAPEIYKSLLDAANLRYQLLPYIYSLGWQTTSNGYTMMRGLPMDFPDDTKARRLDDEFMFGPAFLVQPVTRAMYHVSDPPMTTIPAEALRTSSGSSGMDAQYYSGLDFDKPAGSTVDQIVDHSWPGPPLANPPPGLDGFTNFSARWQGTLIAPETGEYELGIEYDDGGRLYVDNKLLIDDWSFGAKRGKSVNVTFTKGQRVSLTGEFHQGTGNRFFRIAWHTPTELKTLLADKASRKLDNSMSTYLPAGAAWFDFWTHQRYAGGQAVTQNFALDKFPVYVRAGSIVPMGPEVQFATEKPDAPYDVYIYAGADASFTVYEDDNETYAYEKGQRATFTLNWNDAKKTLSVSKRNGSFPALIRHRELKFVLVDSDRSGTSSSATQVIRYAGDAAVVKF